MTSTDATELLRLALLRSGGSVEAAAAFLERSLGEVETAALLDDIDGVRLSSLALEAAQEESRRRTLSALSQSEAIDRMLANPVVAEEFPFEMTVPIEDGRLTEMCELVSRSGLDGTGIFLRSDPEWQRLKPPRHFCCRCSRILMDVRTAAEHGVKYAQEWLDTGKQPWPPQHVPRIPVEYAIDHSKLVRMSHGHTEKIPELPRGNRDAAGKWIGGAA